MTVFISGPVSGMPDFNRSAFYAAAEALRLKGCPSVNPLKVVPYDPRYTWSDYMRACISALMLCDRVVFLPGWWHSRGALLERALCAILGISRDRELERAARGCE